MKQADDNKDDHKVVPLDRHRAPGGNGGGGRDDTRERLVRLEERVNHLATSVEIEGIKSQLVIIKWILAAVAVVILGAVSRYFVP